MSDNKDILQKKAWSTRQMAYAISATAFIIFSATMIWTRFLYIESQVTTNSHREDKREERNAKDREAIWVEINKMKDEHK